MRPLPQQKETGVSTLTGLIDRPPLLLRRALLADAVASGGVGLLMIAGAVPLEGLLGIPAALLRGAGLFLVVYVAFVVYVGTRTTISATGAWTVVAANALWAAGSVLLLISGWIQATALGFAFVLAQALVVALLGGLEYSGLRATA
jgi:hypothetical protein